MEKQLEISKVYHSHTERCGHAKGKDEEIIQTAIKHGVKVLWITDHTPIPGIAQEGIRMNEDQLDEYISTWNNLKEKYENEIEIHVCLEAEYSIEHHDYLKDYLLNRGIEFLIFGEHCYEINGTCLWSNKTYGYRTKEEMRESYLSQLLEGINKGYIRYLAHPDLFIIGQKCFDKDVLDTSRKILDCALKNDVIIEFNIHGVYSFDLKDFYYPCLDFWKLVKKEYNDIKITVGLDAHNLDEYIDNEALRKGLAAIKEIGLKIDYDLDINKLSKEQKENFRK